MLADEYDKLLDKGELVENLLAGKESAFQGNDLMVAREYWNYREKEAHLTETEEQVKKRDIIICEKDQVIGRLEKELEKLHHGLAGKDNQVKQKHLVIREKDQLLLQKDQEMRMKANQLTVAIENQRKKEQEVWEKTQQLLKVEQELHKLRGSYTQRIGKIILLPAKILNRTMVKPAARWVARCREKPPALLHYLQIYERKIDLADQLQANFGRHRSGLKYGLNYLKALHYPGGVLLDVFIERTFCWHPRGIEPYTKPWIGIIHVPPNVPDWFVYEQSNEMIFASEAWEQSLPYCRGLFTMSAYHKKYLEPKLSVPVNHLIFPTETPVLKWEWDKFAANREKKIIQVGWWLRKLHAIYQFPKTDYKKVFLNVEHEILPHLMNIERNRLKKEGTFNDEMYDTAEKIGFLPDKEYDQLLSENIVFIYLYDASANNTITECIARSTPILINPIEPVKEYLGEDYPFYYGTLEEAAAKAMDLDLVYKTHHYLAHHPIKKKLSGKYFLDSFFSSQIYQNLKIDTHT